MKNAFYFMLKTFFVLVIFLLLSLVFGYLKKRLDKKAIVNFKIYDVTDWTTNNDNTHIIQCLREERQPDNKIWSVDRIQQEKHFS